MPNKQSISLFSLMLAVRDARATSTASEQVLLHSLALRCSEEASGGFCCWPSYGTLALDSGVHVVTAKRLCAKLEKLQLIRRKVRHNRSNIFYLNAPRLIQLAEKNKKQDQAAKEARRAARLALVADNPFGVTEFADDAEEVIDADDQTAGEYEEDDLFANERSLA